MWMRQSPVPAYGTMLTYRLAEPLVVIPVGSKEAITLPIGTVLEKDDYLATVGLMEVLLDGKRVTVMVQDFFNSAKAVDEAG